MTRLNRIDWTPGADVLVGTCHCGARHEAQEPAPLWDWLLAHPRGHGTVPAEPVEPFEPDHLFLDRELVVADRWAAADGAVALVLRLPDGGVLPRWEPGAHVDAVLAPGLVRQYSLCGDPADRRSYTVAVLRERDGRGGSAFVHDRVHAGDTVRVRGPRNRFPLEAAERYLFIGGGIGITPLRPMVAAVAARGADWRLVYGGRTRASMAFADDLAGYGDRVTLHPQDERGLLDLDGLLGTPEPGTAVYCCGPEPLLAAVEARCAAWPAGALHLERFAPRPAPPVQARGEPFEIELARDGRTLTVAADRSILETVEAAGIEVLSSCREGTCGTCETALLAGAVEHRDAVLTDAERAAGDTLMICVSRAASDRLVLEL